MEVAVAPTRIFLGMAEREPPLHKRRRIVDSSPREQAPVPATSEPYGQWTQHQTSRHYVSPSQDHKPQYAAASSAGPASSVTASAVNVSEEARWHVYQSSAPAYPDPPSRVHQPYYYHQRTDPAESNTSWPSTESKPASYSADSQGATSTMPLFPSTANRNVVTHSPTVAEYPERSVAKRNTHPKTGMVPPDLAKPPTSPYYFDDASMHLKIQSLPILDNLATQLIHTISKASYPHIQDMMCRDESEDGQAYKTLKNLFDQTRKVYSRETPFIDAIAIQMFQPAQQEIVRKANIATFISSILGAHDVSFFHLNEFFMETFVPLGHRLLKWQGAIYLELKTQTYISALINSDGSPEEMLDELFPPDLDAQILTRHPDAPSLSPSEQDFIDRSRSRKSYLLAEPKSESALRELPRTYQWSAFVREFASCIAKNVEGIMNVPVRSQAASGGFKAATFTESTAPVNASGTSSVMAKAANPNTAGISAAAPQPGEQKRSAPAASTIRQPWSKQEEDALLAGLERVNGPHWSQILALYGRGGSVSEVLKDRNQVQLKDKARNLKLWYLKTGKEVPPSLRGVTGELRKRGGARARAALGVADGDDQTGGATAGERGENADGPADQGTAGRRPTKKRGKKS